MLNTNIKIFSTKLNFKLFHKTYNKYSIRNKIRETFLLKLDLQKRLIIKAFREIFSDTPALVVAVYN